MFLAQVIGTVVAPVQIPVLDAEKLLLLRPLQPDGSPAGRARVGIDRAGAGEGDRVLVLDEGNGARQILGDSEAAAKCVVVGFVDYVAGADGELLYDHRERAAR